MKHVNPMSVLRLSVAASALALAQLPLPALAAADEVVSESEASQDETIVVTGSRIRRAGFDTLQPATVQDRQQIEQRAVTNAADLLNEQPGFGVPSAAPIGPGEGGGTNIGQNQVNFLGLGSSRTLTLVNGRRFVSSNSVSNVTSPGSQVDLNMIPISLVERIETIAVGGAPIYGADAIAGTVNIILNTKYQGVALEGQYGISPDYGDAARYRASIVAGTSFYDGRGNITAALDYNNSRGLLYADRPKTAGRGYMFQVPAGPYPFANRLYENGTVVATNEAGLPMVRSIPGGLAYFGTGVRLNPADANSPFTQFDGAGNLVPFNLGTPTGNALFSSGGDGRNMAYNRSLANDVKRLNANLFASYDITDHVRLKMEGWFVRSKSTALAREGQYQSALISGTNSLTAFGQGPVPVLLSNPFVTAGTFATISRAIDFDRNGVADNTIDTNGDGVSDAPGFFIDRNFASMQDGLRTTASQTLYRLVAGFDGDVGIGGSSFAWDVGVVYGRARSSSSELRVAGARFAQAVNAVRDPVSGAIVCADQSNGCRPLNPMVLASAMDPAAIAFVTARYEPVSVNSQFLASANISGPLFRLPAGEVKMGLGLEYRRERASFDPGETSRMGLFYATEKPSGGGFNTREAYGELLIPLIGPALDIPLVHRLEFEGAARIVDNSFAGSDVTWTAGGRYQPIPDVEFRGNYTRSIRAPSITELFLPEVQVAILARDPCDRRFINQGNFPSRRAANCAAAGIAQPFQSRLSDATLQGLSSGNPNLKNEQARSWSIGTVLRPSFLPRFELAADWIDVRIADGIETLSGEAMLEACYDSAAFPDEPVCDSFTRASNGQVTTMRTGYVNVGSIQFAGLNVTANYLLNLDRLGSLGFRVDYSYVDDLTFTIGAQNPRQRAGEVGNSKHRVNATMTWAKGAFSVSNQLRWISGTAFDTRDSATTRDVARYPAWWTLNSSIGFDIDKRFSLQLNIENVFDRRAPRASPLLFGTSSGGLLTYYDGIRGRYASLTARVKF